MLKRIVFLTGLVIFFVGGYAQTIAKLKMADVVQRMNQPNDTTYIVNFWATFCKPCVQEMPGLLKLASKYKGQKVTLLLVSVDLPSYYPKRIAAFVTKQKWKASIAWLNETNADYFCPMIDSSWSGAIPATVVVNAKRGYKKFWEGEVKEIELDKELKSIAEVQKYNGYLGKFRYPMNEVTDAMFSSDYLRGPAAIQFDGATVFSNDSTVYALTGGKVQSVLTVEEMIVLIIKKDSLYYAYSNLKTSSLKKGDVINANDVIGYAGRNLDDKIAVDLYLTTKDGNFTLRKENFIARSYNDFFSLPPKGIAPQ